MGFHKEHFRSDLMVTILITLLKETENGALCNFFVVTFFQCKHGIMSKYDSVKNKSGFLTFLIQ